MTPLMDEARVCSEAAEGLGAVKTSDRSESTVRLKKSTLICAMALGGDYWCIGYHAS